MNVSPTIVFADFETPFPTQWQQFVQACKLEHVISIKIKLVVENTISVTQQAVCRERLWGKSFLEVCDCFAFEFLFKLPNDMRVEQFCDYC
jgi:hypothetical protein